MNSKLKDIIAYFCLNYPFASDLSKARLTKLVYLADWFSALADGRTLTDIRWVFNHYGPYVDDVMNVVNRNSDFRVSSEFNYYGSEKSVISYVGYMRPSLSNREAEIIDFVIQKTQNMYFDDFIDFVYSTYPVQVKSRYSHLNLADLAYEYKLSN